jgi:hypothetical protein
MKKIICRPDLPEQLATLLVAQLSKFDTNRYLLL